jgi:hypothetical protein
MPRTKSWIDRIPLILQHLETDASPVYDRRGVETLFGIARFRATELMKIAGATVEHGKEASVTRQNLKYYVEHCPEAKLYMEELERKEKLASRLRQAAHPIHGLRDSDEWTRLDDLPNVAITPGQLRIVFTSRDDLVATLYKLAKAAANEWDQFGQMCEEPQAVHVARG